MCPVGCERIIFQDRSYLGQVLQEAKWNYASGGHRNLADWTGNERTYAMKLVSSPVMRYMYQYTIDTDNPVSVRTMCEPSERHLSTIAERMPACFCSHCFPQPHGRLRNLGHDIEQEVSGIRASCRIYAGIGALHH